MTDEYVTEKLSNERYQNVLKSLEDLHEKIDNLDKTVRNGLSEKVSSNNTHIRVQWYLLGGAIVGVILLAFRVIAMGI